VRQQGRAGIARSTGLIEEETSGETTRADCAGSSDDARIGRFDGHTTVRITPRAALPFAA
jgi:hypothetical protein